MNARSNPAFARCRTRPVDSSATVADVLVSLSRRSGAAVLESSAPHQLDGRFSILACDPVHTLSVPTDHPAPLDALAAELARFPVVAGPATGPFCGGWIGYISYETGLSVEGLRPTTRNDIDLPALRFTLYDTAGVFDHAAGRWQVVGVDWPGDSGIDRPALDERLDDLSDLIASAQPAPEPDFTDPIGPAPTPNVTRREYLQAVDRVQAFIRTGDVYQVNFTQRFSTSTTTNPWDLYRRLRRANPAPFAALLQWDDRAILSASPELFLDLRGHRVITRPIKGTRPRTGDPGLDAIRRRELPASDKDRAELAMIVDLLRNDLGRVCRYGSVEVLASAELETHPTVYHLVGTVTGLLRARCDRMDLLKATLPGGSITGAPKIRAMQIIDALEPTCRSAYCGVIGYLGLDGSMALNLAIRTMIQQGEHLHLFAGGGIVADSDPADEYDESLAKAAGMMRALGHETSSLAQLRQVEAQP
ncbi:MAG: aminodeoxychorismate synthase component I [Phycisphaerae bacterium]